MSVSPTPACRTRRGGRGQLGNSWTVCLKGKWDWKPHEKSMTLSRLATHVAEIPSWSQSILMADEIDFMSPEMQAWTPREMQSKEADPCRA